jgi:pimeloyl-ACP methyl ester carboxylesterase
VVDGQPAPAAVAPEVRPVVLLHGFDSNPDIFRGSEIYLAEAGFEPLLVPWRPGPGHDARQTATDVVLPGIEAALSDAGHPPDVRFHVVAHSMGGLMVRYLLEQATPELAQRVESLVMISTPNHGPRTGLGHHACNAVADRDWRRLGCDLKPKSAFITGLGQAVPDGLPTRYLAIGVESFEPFLPHPPFDGDGDGVARGHDKVVMAESAHLDGAPFVVFRAWGRRGDHHGSTCATELNAWVLGFLRDGTVPTETARRLRAGDLCEGMPKGPWRRERGF